MLQGRKCASGCRLVVPLVGLGKKAFLVAAILQQPPFHSSLLNDLLNILQIFREKICQRRTAILRQKKLLRPMEPESFEQEAAEHSEGGMLTALGNLRALRIYFRPPTNLLD